MTTKTLSTEDFEKLQEAIAIAVSRTINSDAVMQFINEEIAPELTRAAAEVGLDLDLNADPTLVGIVSVSIGERPYGRVRFTFEGEVK